MKPSVSFRFLRGPAPRLLAAILVASLIAPRTAYAYIDPGVGALVAQWLFAVVFGTIAAWIAAPWQWIKSLFRRKPPPAPRDDSTPDDRA